MILGHRNCADVLSAHPVNSTFGCCFHTKNNEGNAVSGEIRQGNQDDWISSSDMFKIAGIICIVIGGIILLCTIGRVCKMQQTVSDSGHVPLTEAAVDESAPPPYGSTE